MSTRLIAAALALTVVGLTVPPAVAAPQNDIKKISRAAGGGPTNGTSGDPDVSATGRYVVYASGAENIVGSDLNGAWDVYLVDRRKGTTRSLTRLGDSDSHSPRISADGNRVAFLSSADNLVPGDGDGLTNVFVWTRGRGIRRVDVAVGGGDPNLSAAAFDISATGRYVAFTSGASNLVGGTVSSHHHVYVRDLKLRRTRVLDRAANGAASMPSVDAGGDRVAFVTQADNLAPQQNDLHDSVVVWRKGKPFRNLTPSSTGSNYSPAISDDGTKVVFVSSIRLTGADSDNHDDIYYVDLVRRRTRLVSRGSTDYDDYGPAISGDGRFVGFNSQDDLVTGDPNDQADAYRWSAARNRLVRLSGSATVAPSEWPRLNRNGSVVAFVAFDLEFVPSDNNLFVDVFVRRFG